MTIFGDYSGYYDLFYGGKDYRQEVAYIKMLLDKYGHGKVRKILDLGCGTARHDLLLAELGYEVTGVDRSTEMLALARKRFGGRLVEGDVRDIELAERFDAVVALFHVLSYQTTNDDVHAMIQTARKHLNDEGLFICDFWYGPAVTAQRPEQRVKELENDKLKVIRRCEPILHAERKVVDVNYEIEITSHIKMDEHKEPFLHRIKETHSMRYFFRSEVEIMLAQSGFRILQFSAWLEEKSPTEGDWSALVVGRKIHREL